MRPDEPAMRRDPDARRLQQAHELLARHHCHAERRGRAWLIRGPGVHLLVADLCRVTKGDLQPVRGPDD